MPSANNDDFLTQVQLRAVALLEADVYFSASPAIPVISEVTHDVVQHVKAQNPGGLICIVGLMDMRFVPGGGTRQVQQLMIRVRVRESISINRSLTNRHENSLRVAQKAALLIDSKPAAMSTDATPQNMGGTFTLVNISPGLADEPGVQAWHVDFAVTGGGLCDFTRRASAPAAGSP